jgi:predicted Zn-dependent protease with MMP-like domain
MLTMEREAFEALVDEALAALPDDFRGRLANVAIAVEDWADRETLRAARLKHPTQLLGFYHGIPLSQRGSGYNMVAPDRISIYRMPILRQCRDEDEARETVRHVLQHEIAHHFGIDDDRLHELGWA